jgi:hypothetical protein
LICHHRSSIYSQRWRSTSEFSASTALKSRNGYVPRVHVFFCERLDTLVYRYDKCLNRLGDYVEK